MGKDECRVLVVGLDGAGKTTIVKRLKYGVSEDKEVIPTIGFNIECVEYKKMIFSLWDLGGAKETRSFWRFYYEGSQGIIFVFDSTSDALRVEEAREDLHRLLTEHELWDAPLLVMANKQDEPRAMAPREITEKLQLYSLANRNWCAGPMQTLAVAGCLPLRLTASRPSRGQVHCGHQGAASRREGGKPPRRSRATARLKECPPRPPPANPSGLWAQRAAEAGGAACPVSTCTVARRTGCTRRSRLRPLSARSVHGSSTVSARKRTVRPIGSRRAEHVERVFLGVSRGRLPCNDKVIRSQTLRTRWFAASVGCLFLRVAKRRLLCQKRAAS